MIYHKIWWIFAFIPFCRTFFLLPRNFHSFTCLCFFYSLFVCCALARLFFYFLLLWPPICSSLLHPLLSVCTHTLSIFSVLSRDFMNVLNWKNQIKMQISFNFFRTSSFKIWRKREREITLCVDIAASWREQCQQNRHIY